MIRFNIVLVFFAIVWIIILARLFIFAINKDKYAELANKNILKKTILAPARGSITDRNGEHVAVNTLGFSIDIQNGLYQKKDYEKLNQILNDIVKYMPFLNINELKDKYIKLDSPYNHEYIKIVDFLPYDSIYSAYTALSHKKGIHIAPTIKRFYPFNDIAAHIIGYVGKANNKDMKNNKISKYTKIIGKIGIEKQYNNLLQGELGYRLSQVNAFNEEINIVKEVPPFEQNNLQISIDIKLQKHISQVFKDKAGSAIILDVNNGEILAAGSFPEFDPNLFVNGISVKKWKEIIEDPKNPFTNKIVNGLYPPASTIKMGVGLSFLENDIFKENERVLTPPFIKVGGRKFRDWKVEGHGSADLRKAIKRSVDVYFYKGALKSGIDNMASTLDKMGLGAKTGVDLPNEFIGILPTTQWKKKRYKEKWYEGDTLSSSIGQGYFLSTPLQVAKYTAMIATGKSITPHFNINMKTDTNKYTLNEFQLSKLHILREAMYQACNTQGGTLTHIFYDSKVRVACKTGTAQVIGISQKKDIREKEEHLEYEQRSHAWTTLFLPYDKPKYAVTVLNEHGGHGSSGAGILARRITDKMIQMGYLKR